MFPKMPKCADYWKKEYLMDNFYRLSFKMAAVNWFRLESAPASQFWLKAENCVRFLVQISPQSPFWMLNQNSKFHERQNLDLDKNVEWKDICYEFNNGDFPLFINTKNIRKLTSLRFFYIDLKEKKCQEIRIIKPRNLQAFQITKKLTVGFETCFTRNNLKL